MRFSFKDANIYFPIYRPALSLNSDWKDLPDQLEKATGLISGTCSTRVSYSAFGLPRINPRQGHPPSTAVEGPQSLRRMDRRTSTGNTTAPESCRSKYSQE